MFKIRSSKILLIGFLSHSLHAEERKNSLIDPALFGFGPPAFAVEATGSGEMNFENGGGSVSYQDSRALIPLWNKEVNSETFVGATLACGLASLDTNQILGMDRLDLSTVELQFTGSHFPASDSGWMGLGILSPGLTTDFNHLSSNDLTFSILGVMGYQFTPQFTLAGSAYVNYSINQTTAIPGVGIIWRPQDSLIVQLTPPVAAIGWTPTKDWTFSISAYPSGGAWDVDREGKINNVESVKLEGWRTGLGVEHQIGEHFKITTQVGVNLAGKLELRDNSDHLLLNKNLNSSPFGLLGISYLF
jgi:Domain of unknown function (DUF6268)